MAIATAAEDHRSGQVPDARHELGFTPAVAAFTLAAAVIGFFMDTVDTVVVNVALPAIRVDLGATIVDLQWVVDGYTLMFAALLLSAGALSDRTGARRAFSSGLVVFISASAVCGLAPTVGVLIAARFAQGTAAAVMIPSSMALIGQAYPDPHRRARAVAIWAMGGAVASSAGPIVGGLLTSVSWRLIFAINVPAGFAALWLLRRTERSPRHPVPFDWWGQIAAVAAMGSLTYGAIEAGAAGFSDPVVIASFAVAAASIAAFVLVEGHRPDPMVPLDLFRIRNVSVASAVGFAFVVGFYGLPFVVSLFLQQIGGLSPLATGFAFVPMALVGAALTPFSARLAERFGTRRLVTCGLAVMTVGLLAVAAWAPTVSAAALATLMMLVGLGGPLVIPPMTAALLNSVPDDRAGTASGVFNTSRQVGGALAIAVFGALLAQPAGYIAGLRTSLIIAAAVTAAAILAARTMRTAPLMETSHL